MIQSEMREHLTEAVRLLSLVLAQIPERVEFDAAEVEWWHENCVYFPGYCARGHNMSGCFGNSAEDRWRERQLDEYLNSQEIPAQCEDCLHADDCEMRPAACITGALPWEGPDV
jgi:hypothetical protein